MFRIIQKLTRTNLFKSKKSNVSRRNKSDYFTEEESNNLHEIITKTSVVLGAGTAILHSVFRDDKFIFDENTVVNVIVRLPFYMAGFGIGGLLAGWQVCLALEGKFMGPIFVISTGMMISLILEGERGRKRYY